MWNMKVVVKPIVVKVLGRVAMNLEKRLGELEIRGRTEDTTKISSDT